MSNYAIGDIQGCLTGLKRLLDTLNFSESDQLYFAGDLINRGKESLETLRYIKALPNATTVLGNHDLHLLAVYFNVRESEKDDTLKPILMAEDADELITWLKNQTVLLHIKKFDAVLVHAGLHPNWSLTEALTYAKEIQNALQSNAVKTILNESFGNNPNRWDNTLTGTNRIRCLINYFTRMRYCQADGSLDFTYKGKPPHPFQSLKPWFDFPLAIQKTILFGHWAAIQGKLQHKHVIALDTGYVWGGELTAYCFESKTFFQVKAN